MYKYVFGFKVELRVRLFVALMKKNNRSLTHLSLLDYALAKR